MLKLEEIVEGTTVEGLSPHGVALVKSVKWLGSDRIEVVYKCPSSEHLAQMAS
jgi:hypothetical protein